MSIVSLRQKSAITLHKILKLLYGRLKSSSSSQECCRRAGIGGVISSTPFALPFPIPSTGMRTRELYGPGYYHVGSPADAGYVEQMWAIYGREDVDPPRQDPQTSSSSSQGTSSQLQGTWPECSGIPRQ